MTKKKTKKTPENKIEAKKAEAKVSTRTGKGNEVVENEQVGDERMFTDPPCNVGYSSGFTIPIPGQDYASFKAQVSIYIPCKHEEINGAYEFAEQWVDERSTKIHTEFMEQFD